MSGTPFWAGHAGLWQTSHGKADVLRKFAEKRLPFAALAYRGGFYSSGSTPIVVLGFERPGFGDAIGDHVFTDRGEWSGDVATAVVRSMSAEGVRALLTLDSHRAAEIHSRARAAGLVTQDFGVKSHSFIEDFTTPCVPTLLLILGQLLAWSRDQGHGVLGDGPLAVHCAGGSGRTALVLMAFYMVRERGAGRRARPEEVLSRSRSTTTTMLERRAQSLGTTSSSRPRSPSSGGP